MLGIMGIIVSTVNKYRVYRLCAELLALSSFLH